MKKTKAKTDITPRNKRVQIGTVGVDSGQLLICDPCYLSTWQTDDGTGGTGSCYVDKYGRKWGCGMHRHKGADLSFGDYETKLAEFEGRTPNQLIEAGEWTEVEPKQTGNFSYNGASLRTCYPPYAGQLGNGTGVVSSSGYGDGAYAVYATYNKDGCVVKLEVEMK